MSSGSLYLKEANPGYYTKILEGSMPKPFSTEEDRESNKQRYVRIYSEIERDLARSLPRHPFYSKGSGQSIDRLRNVLRAYSQRRPQIGYCQSMVTFLFPLLPLYPFCCPPSSLPLLPFPPFSPSQNIVAATLLLYMSEEDAFWLLATICENIVPDYYCEGIQLMGSIVDLQIFIQLVRRYLPELEKHMTSVRVFFLCGGRTVRKSLIEAGEDGEGWVHRGA
jgi:hypothetical protein